MLHGEGKCQVMHVEMELHALYWYAYIPHLLYVSLITPLLPPPLTFLRSAGSFKSAFSSISPVPPESRYKFQEENNCKEKGEENLESFSIAGSLDVAQWTRRCFALNEATFRPTGRPAASKNDTHTSVLEAGRGHLNDKGAAGIMTYPAWCIGGE